MFKIRHNPIARILGLPLLLASFTACETPVDGTWGNPEADGFELGDTELVNLEGKTEVAFPREEGSPIPVTIETDDGSFTIQGLVKSDFVVVGGDVVVGRIDEMEDACVDDGMPTPPSCGKRAATSRWPGRVVPYMVDPAFSAAVQADIATAIQHWEDNSPIDFRIRTTETDFVDLEADAVNDCGDGIDNDLDGNTDGADAECAAGYSNESFSCWSWLGHQGDAQTVFLNGCSSGSIVHELGHALGLYYEQFRCDRDDHVIVTMANVIAGNEGNFDKWGDCDSDDNGYDLGPYDHGSIMHYGSGAFAVAGTNTITMLDGTTFNGQRIALSEGDIEGIRRMYMGEVPLTRDIDSDGYDDLAVGARGYTVSGHSGAGAVNVIFGSDLGLTSAGDQLFSQDTTGVRGISETDDYFGYDLALGDFDGDTYADLAVGVPFEEGSAGNCGYVNVLYGSDNGLTGDLDDLWSQNTSGVEGTSEASDYFGYRVAAGDFDGDGFADLVVGVPYESLGSATHAGAVNVLYGSVDGLTSDGDQMWHQDSSGVDGFNENSDRFGHALATGDFDGDSFGDLVVGVPFEDLGGTADAGAINILYGSDDGLTSVGDQFLYQDSSGVEGTSEAGDLFGYQLATGDFDGNGYTDIAIGVPHEAIGSTAEAGAVNVLYGTQYGVTSTGDDFWSQDTLGISDSPQAEDHFGQALAAGDFDGDGYWDLAIGVPDEDVDGVSDAGAIHVLYGEPGGLDTDREEMWHQDSTSILSFTEDGDQFGLSLTVGDYDGDGFTDLAVGAPGEEYGGATDHGIVQILYGSQTGLNGDGDQVWSQDTANIGGTGQTGGDFGISLP